MISTNYKLEIPGMESVNYFITNTALPSLTMNGVETAFQNNQIQLPSDRVDYDPLNVTFLVDEDLANYISLNRWMYNFKTTERPIDHMKDIKLHLLTNNLNPLLTVTYYGAFPVMLGEIPLETGVADATPIILSATFKYQYFEFE